MRPLYLETGHWGGDFQAEWMTGSGRQLVVMNGCFVDA
jgi:hypothetical protein